MNDPRHSRPSASALARLEACPASWALSQEAERRGRAPPAGPEAESGRAVHKWLETESDADWGALSLAEQDTAAMCFDQAVRVIADWRGDSVLDKKNEYREHRLGLTALGTVIDVTPDTKAALVVTGQADVIWLDPPNSRGLVIDYKSGRGEYEKAAGNAQLRGLAVLAADRWKLKTVRVALIQPWEGPPTLADFDTDTLFKAGAWLERVIYECDKPHEPVTGPQCQFCDARLICPALRETVTTLPAHLTHDGLPEGKEIAAMTARAMELPGDELAHLLNQRRMSRWFWAAIESAAVMKLEQGQAVDGWELRDRNGKRSITDPGAASQVLEPLLASAAGGAQAALLRSAVLRPAAVEEEIRIASGPKINKDGSKSKRYNLTGEDAKEHLKNTLGPLMTQKTSRVLARKGEALEDDDE